MEQNTVVILQVEQEYKTPAEQL